MIMKKTKINILSLFNNTKGLNKSGTTPSSVSPRIGKIQNLDLHKANLIL